MIDTDTIDQICNIKPSKEKNSLQGTYDVNSDKLNKVHNNKKIVCDYKIVGDNELKYIKREAYIYENFWIIPSISMDLVCIYRKYQKNTTKYEVFWFKVKLEGNLNNPDIIE